MISNKLRNLTKYLLDFNKIGCIFVETLNHMKDLNTDLSLLSEEFSNRIEKIKQKYIAEPLGVGWYANIFTKGLFGYRLKDDGNFSIEGKEISTDQRISDPHYWVRPDEFDSSEITRLMTDECKRRFMGKTVKCLLRGKYFKVSEVSEFSWNGYKPDKSFWACFESKQGNNCMLWSAEKGFAEVVEEESPKDGEWCISETHKPADADTYIYKHFKMDGDKTRYHILINDKGLMYKDQICYPINPRKITKEEALPYLQKYFEKQGFKEGMEFISASSNLQCTFHKVEVGSFKHKFDFWTKSGNGCLFDNDTNTFATLVIEDKITVGGDDVVKGQYHYLKFKNAILNKRDLESWEEIIELGGKIEFNGEVLTIEKINQLRELANK